ncbi:MAG: protein phosphatase 2C domain-containing protein [Pseudomonadota bacterium]
MPHYETSTRSHVGHRYQHNEDRIGCDPARGVWIVADGMGGHARGDIAAEVAVEALLGAHDLTSAPLDALLLRAHGAVQQQGRALGHEAMGSTAVVLRLPTDDSLPSAELAWCGDSRGYLWRGGELVQLTRDHSLLEELIKSGLVRPEEAFGHPQKHVLVQALGIDDPAPRPGVVRVPVRSGDLLLLCSDGLHDELPEAALRAAFANAGVSAAARGDTHRLDALTKDLEAAVLQAQARDNISVVVVAIVDVPAGPAESAAALRADIAAQWQTLDAGRLVSGETTAATTEVDVAAAGGPGVAARLRRLGARVERWLGVLVQRARTAPLLGIVLMTLLLVILGVLIL